MIKKRKKPTLIMRAGDVLDVIEAYRRIAAIYAALGLPEDETNYLTLAKILERRLYGPPEPWNG